MMLDIIMPHYDEPWFVGKPFFDMLAIQKGVDFSQIRVILVHDGKPGYANKVFAGYPFKVDQYSIDHGGVSAARNFGFEKATAEWITFCDFDDTYTNIYALKLIMESLDENYDLLWNPVYMEDVKDGKMRIFPLEKFNMVFVHNKYIRREFLIETGLKFNTNLQYAEDSAFLAILNIMLKQNKIGQIKTPEPLYVWAYRTGSCTTNLKNRERNIRHLFEANKYISEEMERLGYEDAVLMKFRAITDSYFSLTGKDAVDCEDLKKDVGEYWQKHRQEIGKANREKLMKVYKASYGNEKTSAKDEDRPTLAEWLKEVS